MKKLHIAMVAILATCGAAYASDRGSTTLSEKAKASLQSYQDLMKRFDKDCQVPMFGKWMTSEHQRNGCKDLANTLAGQDRILNEYYGLGQNTYKGPAYEFWRK